MKLSDIMILVSIALFAYLAVRYLRTRKKNGCTGCSGCPMSGSCQKEKEANE